MSNFDTLQATLLSTNSPVSQLILSLQHEIKNWKLLTTFRLIQQLKLNPLPTKKSKQITNSIDQKEKIQEDSKTISSSTSTSTQNLKNTQDQNIKKLYRYFITIILTTILSFFTIRDIRLTRASYRIPDLTKTTTTTKKSFTEQYTTMKLSELKQLNTIRNTLNSFQGKNTLLITK